MSIGKTFQTVTQKLYTFGRYMMKRQQILAGVLALGLLLTLVAGVTLAQEPHSTLLGTSLGTAFTYQGRLMDDSGNPLTGSYDFQFELYDTESGVSQVGSTVTVGDVDVSDGLFTAQLDFSSSPFTGDARWLEIGVRDGSSSGAYTTLSPRQPLTATPYALSLRPGAQVIGNAVYALTAKSTHIIGGYGLYATMDGDTSGAGVFGRATSSSGEVHGVWGESNSIGGYGVYGKAPIIGVYGEASQTSGYPYGVYGKSSASLGAGVRGENTATGGYAFGVYGSTESASGYAGYFSNNAGGGDIAAAGSGIISSTADSVLYLSPHDMVVRGGSGVSATPQDNGGVDIYYWSIGDKYLSIPVSTFGTLFGSPLYVESIQVCYKTDAGGYIDVTSVQKNNGSTGSTSYITSGTDRTSSTHTCYTISVGGTRVVIDNSTWVQFNIHTTGTGHTYIYTVKLTLTEQQN